MVMSHFSHFLSKGFLVIFGEVVDHHILLFVNLLEDASQVRIPNHILLVCL